MGVAQEEGRLYEGRPHEWRAPKPTLTASFFSYALALWVVGLELFFVVGELLLNGLVLPATARAFAVIGIVLLLLGNLKSVALWMRRSSTEALGGLVDVALKRLWPLHFWLNPVGILSLGLFLLFAPRPQPAFYHVAYGVLLWQAMGGLLAREAVPVRAAKGPLASAARKAHRQPAVFVLLVVLVVAGFVQSLFP